MPKYTLTLKKMTREDFVAPPTIVGFTRSRPNVGDMFQMLDERGVVAVGVLEAEATFQEYKEDVRRVVPTHPEKPEGLELNVKCFRVRWED